MDHLPGLRTTLLFLGNLAPTMAAQNIPEAQRNPAAATHATAKELEEQGDALRGQKDYLSSIDFYRAAWKKADSAALHNKAGISFFQLHRNGEAKKEYERSIRLDNSYAE